MGQKGSICNYNYNDTQQKINTIKEDIKVDYNLTKNKKKQLHYIQS